MTLKRHADLRLEQIEEKMPNDILVKIVTEATSGTVVIRQDSDVIHIALHDFPVFLTAINEWWRSENLSP